MLKQARNPGTVEKRIENSDGRTDRLTDYDITDYDMTNYDMTYWRGSNI